MSCRKGPDEDDELDDRELPDESDMDSHDEPSLMPCPHCRKMILEDAEQCHHCGEYVDPHEAPPTRGWMIATVVLLVLALSGMAYLVMR